MIDRVPNSSLSLAVTPTTNPVAGVASLSPSDSNAIALQAAPGSVSQTAFASALQSRLKQIALNNMPPVTILAAPQQTSHPEPAVMFMQFANLPDISLDATPPIPLINSTSAAEDKPDNSMKRDEGNSTSAIPEARTAVPDTMTMAPLALNTVQPLSQANQPQVQKDSNDAHPADRSQLPATAGATPQLTVTASATGNNSIAGQTANLAAKPEEASQKAASLGTRANAVAHELRDAIQTAHTNPAQTQTPGEHETALPVSKASAAAFAQELRDTIQTAHANPAQTQMQVEHETVLPASKTSAAVFAQELRDAIQTAHANPAQTQMQVEHETVLPVSKTSAAALAQELRDAIQAAHANPAQIQTPVEQETAVPVTKTSAAAFAQELRDAIQVTHANPAQVQTPVTPVAREIASPVATANWASEVGNQLVWMTNQRESHANLVLNPPDLGRIEVSISLNGDQASASFVSANPEVRDALQGSLHRLREVLADAGVFLGQANIGAESFQHGGNGAEKGGKSPGDFFSPIAQSLLGFNDGSLATAAALPASTGRGLVDLFA